MSTTGTTGLAAPELTTAERRRQGEANTAADTTTRSYATILRTNVFSFFTIILFVIGLALLALGRYNGAFAGAGSSPATSVPPATPAG